MTIGEAMDLLGLRPGSTEADARRNYRRLLHLTHPDRSSAGDATYKTVRLGLAYRTLVDHFDASGIASESASAHSAQGGPLGGNIAAVYKLDTGSFAIEAPSIEVVPMLVEAANQLGDISYLDPAVGLLEVIVEFLGAPTCSVVLTLQGRSNSTTEIFCSVEALAGVGAPDSAAVTDLLVRTLCGEDPTV